MRTSCTAIVSFVLASNLASAVPILGPITNPANGHDYYLLEASTWTAAEAEAVSLGGHLVTINDAAEDDWLYTTELGSAAHRWIGFTDAGHEGNWVWISGESVTYTDWLPGEPSGGGTENYAEWDHNGWNDVPNDGWGVPHQGIVEVVPGGGALVTVCWDGNGDYLTIQGGIDAASHGDEVVLCEGTYTGDGNRDLDFGGKAITVRSTDPSDPIVVAATVIDCQGSSSSRHRGFDFHSGEGADSVLAGITIENGYAPDTGVSDPGGGGIYCRNGSSPTIDRCVVSRCQGDFGGGVHCRNAGTLPTIVGCTISGNGAAWNGGGIYSHWSDLTVTDSTITGNTARFAGGIRLLYGHHAVTDCIITGNSASMSGGGMSIDQVREAVVLNCRISGNTASEWGGGVLMYNQSPYDGIVTLVNCEITGNNVTGVGTNGGGGGIRTYAMDNATIVNCTIAGNTVAGSGSDGGGGIYSWGGHPKVRNCVVWGNSAGLGDQISMKGLLGQANTLTVSYSDVQDGQAAAEVRSTCTLDWNAGNIDANPSFAGSSDYHVQSGSPCIDAADNTAVPTDTLDLDDDGDTDEPIPFDLDGSPRFIDDPITADTGNGTPPIVDMGAYEYVNSCDIDDECQDGLFCTGVERCTAGVCVADVAPCLPEQMCRESDDQCVDCLDDIDCDDIDPCTGTEACNPDGTCTHQLVADCNANAVEDSCDIGGGTSADCNDNLIPDECDIAMGASQDCDTNGTPDECELDTDSDELIDACDPCTDVDGDGWGQDAGNGIDCPNGGTPDCDDEGMNATDPDIDNACDPDDNCHLYNPGQLDCQPNDVGDVCDIDDGTSQDWNGNDVPDECELEAPDEADSPLNARKNRYISFRPNTLDLRAAYQVEMTSGPGVTGIIGWVGDPEELATDTFISRVVASPTFREWPDVLVNVGDCEIVPVATYEIRGAVDDGFPHETCTDALELHTIEHPFPKYWCDVVGDFVEGAWTGPNGVGNMGDIMAMLQGFSSAPGAPPVTWLDLEPEVPNAIVNMTDVQRCVDAFKGGEYPFPDPADCP